MISYEAFNDQSSDCADPESICAEIGAVALIYLSRRCADPLESNTECLLYSPQELVRLRKGISQILYLD